MKTKINNRIKRAQKNKQIEKNTTTRIKKNLII